jgi:hypothetical protein
MPVITFASFIVVPKNAFALDDIRKPVLEWMLGLRNGLSLLQEANNLLFGQSTLPHASLAPG